MGIKFLERRKPVERNEAKARVFFVDQQNREGQALFTSRMEAEMFADQNRFRYKETRVEDL